MIQPHFDKELDLTTFVCSDQVTAREIEEQVQALYRGRPSLFALWDFSEADLSVLTPEDIRGVAKYVKETSHSRAGGKTALVFSTAMLTGMGPMLESIAEIEIRDAKIKIFNDLKSGLAWITS
jgi:hypothetical protein